MPRIELITPVLYGPNDPIHWEVDNLPLQAILTRQNLINSAVDNVVQQMTDAVGTQNTIANRLNQSINPDGSLKTASIDAAQHTMDDHTDTANYVRMTKAQSDKITLIADEATNLSLQVFTSDTNYVTLDSGIVQIMPSTTVTPEVDSPNIIKFNMAFPSGAAHQHHYGLTPVPSNQVVPDYINYLVTSSATQFIAGTLRIFVNGTRIFSDAEVYVPGATTDLPWTLLSFTENASAGSFELSIAISQEDVIRVDFDVALT